MKKQSIRFHLTPYSIEQRRKTTINHAFASAIAPADDYVEANLDAAIRILGQDPDQDLICVYCGSQAETWDHLVGLVEKAELRGYGHQIGNLVPCCRSCNSSKGAKDWKMHLRAKVPESSTLQAKLSSIQSYLEQYAIPVDLKRMAKKRPDDYGRYCEIKEKIIKLMAEADEIAARLRNEVVARNLA